MRGNLLQFIYERAGVSWIAGVFTFESQLYDTFVIITISKDYCSVIVRFSVVPELLILFSKLT